MQLRRSYDTFGAIGVQTQQEAVNASNIAHADGNCTYNSESAIGAMKQSDRIKDTALNYGAAGQRLQPCLVLNERRTITETQKKDKEIRADMVFQNVTAGTGKFCKSHKGTR